MNNTQKNKFDVQIDILSAIRNSPKELDFLWEGGPLNGTVGALVAPGSSGKSFVALQIAAAIASHDPRADLLGLGVKKYGNVVYFSLEDPQAITESRLNDLGRHLSEDAIKAMARNLKIVPTLGLSVDVMDDTRDPQHPENEAKTTDFNQMLDVLIKNRARLCIIDTVSRAHNLEENSNREMSMLIKRLEQLAFHADCAVLYLHHTSKSAAREGGESQQAGRGASALVDSARWCGNLVKMTPEMAKNYTEDGISGMPINNDQAWLYVSLTTSKINYGEPAAKRWFKRAKGGILGLTELAGIKLNTKRQPEAINEYEAAKNGESRIRRGRV